MKEPTIDEMFEQIAKNQRAMSDLLASHEATLKRLAFRINRIERSKP